MISFGRTTNYLKPRLRPTGPTPFPTGRLHLIRDIYGPHHKAEVRTWCAEHGIELVFTPTNASG